MSSLRSTIAVSLTNYLDAGAIVAGASGLTLWQHYLGLTEAHLGWLNAISANCLGAALGAIVGGFLADRYGRKFIYTYNMLVYMAGVALIMCSTSFAMLLAGFLITGISVGVGVPASWTYISESSETHLRGRNIGISQMAWGIGPTVILILGTLLAPPTAAGDTGGLAFPVVQAVATMLQPDATGSALAVFSSRVIFGSLFIVALIAWLLQRRLDESAQWKQAQQAPKPKGDSLFSNRKAVHALVFLAGMYLTWNLVSSVMGFFQQHIYETAGGLTNEQANMLSVGQWVVIIAMTAVFAALVDKVSQRLLYLCGTGAAVAAWLLIVGIGINSWAALLLFTLLWGIQGGISVQGFYALWASELFPARFRAAAQGMMFFAVRGLSAVWGLVFVGIYGEHGEGFGTAAVCMVALLVASMLIGSIWTPKTRGKTLEQIERERS